MDLGLALGDAEAEGKLEKKPVPGGSDRITHRISLEGVGDVDAEVNAS